MSQKNFTTLVAVLYFLSFILLYVNLKIPIFTYSDSMINPRLQHSGGYQSVCMACPINLLGLFPYLIFKIIFYVGITSALLLSIYPWRSMFSGTEQQPKRARSLTKLRIIAGTCLTFTFLDITILALVGKEYIPFHEDYLSRTYEIQSGYFLFVLTYLILMITLVIHHIVQAGLTKGTTNIATNTSQKNSIVL